MRHQLKQAEQAPTCRVLSVGLPAYRNWLQARQQLLARLPRKAARPGNPDFDGIVASTERLLGALLHTLQCCAKAWPGEGRRQPEQEVSRRLEICNPHKCITAHQNSACRQGLPEQQPEQGSRRVSNGQFLHVLLLRAGMQALHPVFILCGGWLQLHKRVYSNKCALQRGPDCLMLSLDVGGAPAAAGEQR